MPHPHLVIFKIVNSNQKKNCSNVLFGTLLNSCTFIYSFFWKNYDKNKFSSAQCAKFRQIWYHWTTPVIWITDQLSQSIKIWQSAVSQVNWPSKRPLYMPYFSWTIHYWYCIVIFKANLTIIFYYFYIFYNYNYESLCNFFANMIFMFILFIY